MLTDFQNLKNHQPPVLTDPTSHESVAKDMHAYEAMQDMGITNFNNDVCSDLLGVYKTMCSGIPLTVSALGESAGFRNHVDPSRDLDQRCQVVRLGRIRR